MYNMFSFTGLLLALVATRIGAAITPLDVTFTRTIGSDVSIPWIYDNKADMETVEWNFKSSSSPTPTLIMDKVGAAAATVYNNFNVEHVSDGSITLKAVTSDNIGIYHCSVAYSFASGYATVTGTVTLSFTTGAAITPLDVTFTRTLGSDVSIPWTYDDVADIDTIDWTFKSSSSPTPIPIMDKVGAAAATVYNNFNVEHVSGGSITLKAVTLDNVGIYYCTVAYSLFSGLAPVTGTATLSLTTANTPTDDNSTPTSTTTSSMITTGMILLSAVGELFLVRIAFNVLS